MKKLILFCLQNYMQHISSQQNLYTKVLYTKKLFFVWDVWNNGFLMINKKNSTIRKIHRAKAIKIFAAKIGLAGDAKDGLK